MEEDALRSRLFVAMRFIAEVMLRSEVTAREFIEITKMAFVDAASSLYGKPGKPASNAEVARRTALTRGEVSRLRNKVDPQDKTYYSFVPTKESDVLTRWHTDSAYLDELGKPLPLGYGPGEGTFCALVEATHPGTDPAAVLARLRGNDSVTGQQDGRFAAATRSFDAGMSRDGIALQIDMSIGAVAKTVAHNMVKRGPDGWVQRTVYSDQVRSTSIPVVRHSIRSRAANFCEEIDDLLAAHSQAASDENREPSPCKAGIGVFYFEDE